MKIKAVVLLTNWDDQLFTSKVFDECTCKWSTNLEFFNQNSSGNAKDFWHFLQHFLVLGIFKVDIKIKLFLNLNLCPWLLFGLSTFFGTCLLLCHLGILRRIFTCILSTLLLLLSLNYTKNKSILVSVFACISENKLTIRSI